LTLGVPIAMQMVGSPGEDTGDQGRGQPSWYQIMGGCSAKDFHEAQSSKCAYAVVTSVGRFFLVTPTVGASHAQGSHFHTPQASSST
jgi:hypothetical protein